jgi:hypothetical protein
MPKLPRWKSAWCCKEAEGLVYWQLRGKKMWGGVLNPPKTGWTMSVDDIAEVNVNYCPFCGTKLSTLLDDPDAKRTKQQANT